MGEYLSIWYSVLPFDVEDYSEARCVKVVQFLSVTLVYSPCVTGIEQRWKPIALYTFNFVRRLMPRLFWMLAYSQPKVALAFVSLEVTSSYMVAFSFWDSVLPRYKNLLIMPLT